MGHGLHGIHSERDRLAPDEAKVTRARKAFLAKIARQSAKDYLLVPPLSRSRCRRTLAANSAAHVLAFSSGNLCYQIEHQLFADLPSNCLAQSAAWVRQVCEKYDLPDTRYSRGLRTALRERALTGRC